MKALTVSFFLLASSLAFAASSESRLPDASPPDASASLGSEQAAPAKTKAPRLKLSPGVTRHLHEHPDRP